MLPGISGIVGSTGRSLRAVSYQTVSQTGLGTDAFSFSSLAFGAAATDRVIVAAVWGIAESGNSILSATIGGVSATKLVEIAGASDLLTIIAAAVPTGTTGTIAGTFNGSTGRAGVSVWRLVGNEGVTAIATGSNSDLSGLTLATGQNGVAIAACINVDSRTTTWTGASEDYDTDDGTTNASGASVATDGNNLTITPTLSGAATRKLFVAATF
jgi:hypothetical protein